jgi:hypothetical protein
LDFGLRRATVSYREHAEISDRLSNIRERVMGMDYGERGWDLRDEVLDLVAIVGQLAAMLSRLPSPKGDAH